MARVWFKIGASKGPPLENLQSGSEKGAKYNPSKGEVEKFFRGGGEGVLRQHTSGGCERPSGAK